MANTIQLKRGNAAAWTAADPTLAVGEFGFETDTGKFKAGDGSTAWSSLSYFEVAAAEAWSFQGENYGYSVAGTGALTDIQQFSFASDGNATDVGDVPSYVYRGGGHSSSENGYTSGGSPSTNAVNRITKFPFASGGTATAGGDLATSGNLYYHAGHSSSENGYASGGAGTPTETNVIQKFPFSTDANATDVGDTLASLYGNTGHSSPEYGYSSGGFSDITPTGVILNIIQKFPFSADGNGTDVGDLTAGTFYGYGLNSDTAGYHAKGWPFLRTIQKFSFASDENASNIGNLVFAATSGAGASSTSSGYTAGGYIPGPVAQTTQIDKFSFSTDSDAASVGTLVEAARNNSGCQY